MGKACLSGAFSCYDGNMEKTAPPAAIAALREKQRAVATLMQEISDLCRACPALCSPDALSSEELAALVPYNFCFDRLPVEIVGPMVNRVSEKGGLLPAYLTHGEAQVIAAKRFVRAAGFGSLAIEIHEKRRSKIVVALNGR